LDLLFNKVEIVEEPFAGGGNAPVVFCCCRQKVKGLVQYLFIVCQPRQELVRRASPGDHVNGGKAFAMLLHLLFAEQLRAQRSFFTVELCLPNGITQADMKEVPVRLPSSEQVPPSSYMCEYLRQERRCERAK
jgi:hypothetical protein